MTTEQSFQRLVTFLGKPSKGSYEKTTYLSPTNPNDIYETAFVADALAYFLKPHEVVVLATDEAWIGQGDMLQSQLESQQVPLIRNVRLPTGRNENELWSQFEILKQELRLPVNSASNRVALDITHGYRSVPFFGAGVVTFLQLVDEVPPEISIFYGAFEARQENRTPIWSLTPFSDLVAWSAHIMLFLKTGRADGLAEATEAIGRSLRREWALTDRHEPAPTLGSLGQVLARVGGDLETVRTGSLMLNNSSVMSLHAELDAARTTAQSIPPLADVLDRIKSKTEPLLTNARLSEPAGIKALQALARLYFEMGRYAEAASTVREANINRHACSQSDCPGQQSFDKEHREAAEKAWFNADQNRAREIAQVRNDIEHAGYNRQPMPSRVIKEKIKSLIDGLHQEEQPSNA